MKIPELDNVKPLAGSVQAIDVDEVPSIPAESVSIITDIGELDAQFMDESSILAVDLDAIASDLLSDSDRVKELAAISTGSSKES